MEDKQAELVALKEIIETCDNLMEKLQYRDELLKLERELGIKQVEEFDQEDCLFCSG